MPEQHADILARLSTLTNSGRWVVGTIGASGGQSINTAGQHSELARYYGDDLVISSQWETCGIFGSAADLQFIADAADLVRALILENERLIEELRGEA